VLAEEKDRSVSIERTSDGKNAHIVVGGSTLCPNTLTTTATVDDEDDLPENGICNVCKRRARMTEVVTVAEINDILPGEVNMAESDEGTPTVRTDGGMPANEFVSNPNTGTLHRGTRDGGVQCGSSCKSWATVDAPNPLAAVVNHGTPPCSRCFDHTHRLNRVFVKLHTATVIRKDMDELTATLPWSVDDDETAQQEDHAHAD
jgi:hypothetical protein